jgi:hypothetical protein
VGYYRAKSGFLGQGKGYLSFQKYFIFVSNSKFMKIATKEDLKPGNTLCRDGLEFNIHNEYPEGYVQVIVVKNGCGMGSEVINKENAHLYQVKEKQ